MTQAMAAHVDWSTAGERQLRVATLRAGRLGDEARHPESLVVGRTEKADVVVDAPRQRLFERAEGGWFLRLTGAVAGRVASGGPVRTLEQLRAEGLDRLRLAPDARGRLEIGGVAILFQLVPPRPKAERAPLPQSVRGAFVIDWGFTTSLASVATLLFGLLIGLEGADWPLTDEMTLPPSYEVMLTFDEPEPPPPPIAEAEVGEPSEDPVTEPPPEPSPGPRRSDGRPSPSDGEVSLDPDRIASVQNEVIGTIRDSIGASFADVIDGASPTGDLEELLGDVDRVENPRAAGNVTERDTRGSSEDRPLGEWGDERGPAGPTEEGGALAESTATGPTTDFGPFRPEEPRVFDDALVLRRLRGVKRRVQRCYEREVTRDPTLAGRIDVELEVHPAGNTSARITSDGVGSRGLAQCITGAASSIRFAAGPEGGSVRYSFPFLFASQR